MLSESEYLHQFIKNALVEDIGDGDHTSLACIPDGTLGKARLLIKEEGVVAGVEIALLVFQEVDRLLGVKVFINDGETVKPGDVVLTVEGSTHSILKAERLVLNIMQRMSGIATATRRITTRLKGTATKVLDTRKTTPGMRLLEKKAVATGGGVNHRFGLYDMILIKDNHIDYAGGISKAIVAANRYTQAENKNLKIEIEARNRDEVKEVLQTGSIHRIMLDNFSYDELRKAVELIDGRYETEASGGITEDNVVEYANCGVDFVSMGALTHSIKSLDMSLKAL